MVGARSPKSRASCSCDGECLRMDGFFAGEDEDESAPPDKLDAPVDADDDASASRSSRSSATRRRASVYASCDAYVTALLSLSIAVAVASSCVLSPGMSPVTRPPQRNVGGGRGRKIHPLIIQWGG